jgi:hypothetical protein
LFILYDAWDVISMVDIQLSSQYDWRYNISGDVLTSIVFFDFWIALLKTIMHSESAIMIAGTLIVYGFALSSWFKKAPNPKVKTK